LGFVGFLKSKAARQAQMPQFALSFVLLSIYDMFDVVVCTCVPGCSWQPYPWITLSLCGFDIVCTCAPRRTWQLYPWLLVSLCGFVRFCCWFCWWLIIRCQVRDLFCVQVCRFNEHRNWWCLSMTFHKSSFQFQAKIYTPHSHHHSISVSNDLQLGGQVRMDLVMLELYLLILPWWELVFFTDDVNAFIWCNIIWSNELTLLGEGTIIWTWLSFMRMKCYTTKGHCFANACPWSLV
jgi:hypothetical protein